MGLVPVSAQSVPPLPDSTLPLTLVGVAVNTAAPARSAGIIRCTYAEDRVTAISSPGERACDLAEIIEVREDAVVIRNLLTNRLELVALRSTSALSGVPPPTRVEAPQPPVVTTSPNLVSVKLRPESIAHYLSNLPELLDSSLATPRYHDAGNGQRAMEGFEISQIREGGVVEQLGLRDGDVIVEVNGDKLDSLASVMRLVGQAQLMTQAKMIVLRNGQRMTFVFDAK